MGHRCSPNVKVNSSKEDAATAPQAICLKRKSFPTIGSASSSTIDLNYPFEV